MTRDEKSARVEKLMAQKDELEAEIALLTKEISELTKQVAQIDKSVAEANKLRADEKATNTQTIKEAKAAQDATARALKVLQEFYAKAGIAESFVQADPPEIFDSPY
jgi:chromosome segregation ATPase